MKKDRIKLFIIPITIIILSLMNCSNIKGKQMENGKIPNKVIYIEQLEEMFNRMETNSKWDFKKPMLWGYFFTNKEPTLLEKAKIELVKDGYRFVDIYKSTPEEADRNDLWWLHVEKEEIHTPQSLDKRNDQLYVFADKMGLESYDGMDVGPIKK
jgi:hypothetical protein